MQRAQTAARLGVRGGQRARPGPPDRPPPPSPERRSAGAPVSRLSRATAPRAASPGVPPRCGSSRTVVSSCSALIPPRPKRCRRPAAESRARAGAAAWATSSRCGRSSSTPTRCPRSTSAAGSRSGAASSSVSSSPRTATGLATTLIGCLPGYGSIGVAAPLFRADRRGDRPAPPAAPYRGRDAGQQHLLDDVLGRDAVRSGLVGDLGLHQRSARIARVDAAAGHAVPGSLQGHHLAHALQRVLGRHTGHPVGAGSRRAPRRC
jgi:hypothetical protein